MGIKFVGMYFGPDPHRWILSVEDLSDDPNIDIRMSNKEFVSFIDDMSPESGIVELPNHILYLSKNRLEIGKVCLYEAYCSWLTATGHRNLPVPQPFHIKSYGELCDTLAGVKQYYATWGGNLYEHDNCPIPDCPDCQEHWEKVGKWITTNKTSQD